jgi:hypothetical protein
MKNDKSIVFFDLSLNFFGFYFFKIFKKIKLSQSVFSKLFY